MRSLNITCVAAIVSLLCLLHVSAFSTSFMGHQVQNQVCNSRSASLTMEYIPSGMSKEQYKKMKEKERAKTVGKNLGKVGITSFKSRSFSEWQKAGGKNLFPVDPKSVKNKKEIPYMQRAGGTADDSDLKKPNFFSNLFKKKEEEVEEESRANVNWWTGGK